MGVDYDGKLMVGLNHSEIPEDCFNEWLEAEGLDEEEDYYFHDFLDSLGMTHASLWYDAQEEHWIMGVELGDLLLEDDSYIKIIEEAKDRFIKTFGVTPRLIGTQHIW